VRQWRKHVGAPCAVVRGNPASTARRPTIRLSVFGWRGVPSFHGKTRSVAKPSCGHPAPIAKRSVACSHLRCFRATAVAGCSPMVDLARGALGPGLQGRRAGWGRGEKPIEGPAFSSGAPSEEAIGIGHIRPFWSCDCAPNVRQIGRETFRQEAHRHDSAQPHPRQFPLPRRADHRPRRWL
jgi:hypothetical protein